LADVGDVFFKGVGVDQDVIKVNNAEKIKIIAETIVGIGLWSDAGAAWNF